MQLIMYIHICIYCYIYSLPAGHLAEWAAGKTSLRGNKNQNVVTDSTTVQFFFPSGKLTVCH